MVDAVEWPVEQIPDSSSVYMRAHRQHFRNGQLSTGVFRAQGNGMSVNWDRYSSPELTRSQASGNPEDNAVMALAVAEIRRIDTLSVIHTPEPHNQAHSEVFGLTVGRELLTEIRVRLGRIAKIVLPLPASVTPATHR